MAMCHLAIDAGILRDRIGEEEPGPAVARALHERLGPRADRAEQAARYESGPNHDMLVAPMHITFTNAPEAEHSLMWQGTVEGGALMVYRDTDHMGHRFLGPNWHGYERHRKGWGEAVRTLLWEMWTLHGPGAWTTDWAHDECQGLHWMGEADPAMAVDEYREGDEEGNKDKTDAQILDDMDIPEPKDFPEPRHRHDRRIRDPKLLPPELRPLALPCFEVLGRIERFTGRDTGTRRRDPFPCHDLNQRRGLEAVDWNSACPLCLQWQDSDACLRILDDSNENEWNAGEHLMGLSGYFQFDLGSAESLRRATERCGLFFDLIAAACPFTLAATSEHGVLANGTLAQVLAPTKPVPTGNGRLGNLRTR